MCIGSQLELEGDALLARRMLPEAISSYQQALVAYKREALAECPECGHSDAPILLLTGKLVATEIVVAGTLEVLTLITPVGRVKLAGV